VRPQAGGHAAAASEALRSLGQEASPSHIHAVGHRVVHGGSAFHDSVRIDAEVLETLGQLSELAPLHNPPAMAVMEAARDVLSAVPHVAVFDTAFYADLPPRAHVYPLPYEWYSEWGIRRFGFHGLSHTYCAGRAAELLRHRIDSPRIVSCHLGNGCSATAIQGGKAVSTTMGFTPMEGLMMGSRSGSIDPGILFYVERRRHLQVSDIDDILNHRSGLLGVSGVSSDFREVEAAAQKGHERARLALGIYADRIRAAVGALAATLGGLDALLFTAGIGEHSASLRAEVCRGLECLGVALDAAKNADTKPDADVAATDSAARVFVLRTREELMIARETMRVLLAEPA
jgi:acetate kinase